MPGLENNRQACYHSATKTCIPNCRRTAAWSGFPDLGTWSETPPQGLFFVRKTDFQPKSDARIINENQHAANRNNQTRPSLGYHIHTNSNEIKFSSIFAEIPLDFSLKTWDNDHGDDGWEPLQARERRERIRTEGPLKSSSHIDDSRFIDYPTGKTIIEKRNGPRGPLFHCAVSPIPAASANATVPRKRPNDCPWDRSGRN